MHYLWGAHLIHLIMLICLLSHLLCLKCLWGSEDSIFVHYVFQYIYFELCTNIGELLYFHFKTLFCSYHNILLFPFGLICCFQLVCRILWLLASFVMRLLFYSFGNLRVLDIVLLPPKYSSLDMCEGTPLEELLLYLPSRTCHPFRQSMPMGEKF